MVARQVMWVIIILLLLYGVGQLFYALFPAAYTRYGFPFNVIGRKRQLQKNKVDEMPESDWEEDEDEESFDDVHGLRVSEPVLYDQDSETKKPHSFQSGMELQRMKLEIEALRTEMAEQQKIVKRLEEEVQSLQGELGKAISGQSMAPQYGEALILARRGLTVELIAERCDISVAEASLVKAMAAEDTDENRGAM